MEEIRRGLEMKLDVSIYADPYYNWKQMIQIRHGLMCNLDVSKYSDPTYSWDKMNTIRLELLEQKECPLKNK